MASTDDVDRAVDAARRARGRLGRTAPTERSRLLHALADAIQANRKELAELEACNVGKAISSVKAELNQGVENFRSTPPRSRRSPAARTRWEARFFSLKEPVGVAGQIVPWNYPLTMTTWKLAPALAAGCTIVLKPDSQTPTALRMAELASEVGFPPGVINIVPGEGKTVGAHLVQHPGVDKVAFTGSTATGAEIMRLGSDSIKRLTSSSAGRARTSSSPTRTSTRSFRRRCGRSTTRPDRAARPDHACSSRSRSTTSSCRASPRARRR